jgi:3-oxoacyl-[acyl-carrier protein] reductase
MGKLGGKVAIITGGARGMGREIALTFAREGADIVIADLSDMEETARAIGLLGRKCIEVKADVSKKSDIRRLIAETIEAFKKVDILVNNAGINRRGSLLELREEDWDAVFSVNMKGVFLCTQAAAKVMTERRYGKIVNIASRAGMRVLGPDPVPSYGASKGGVVQFTRISAYELGPYGINVNAVAPGPILTDLLYLQRSQEEAERFIEARKKMSRLGRIGTPQDIANIALFLASEDSSLITGQIIIADGGIF